MDKILDKKGLLRFEFMPDNSICYTVGNPGNKQGSQHTSPFLPQNKVFVECSMQELVNVALSKLYDPYKTLAKYCVGVSDHKVTINAPLSVISNELRDHIYEDCFSSIEIHYQPQTIQFEVWLKDFHTDVRLSWKNK